MQTLVFNTKEKTISKRNRSEIFRRCVHSEKVNGKSITLNNDEVYKEHHYY